MASLMENLMDILEKENTEYEALLELSKKKTPIIIKGDIAALQQITDEEQLVVDKVVLLDRKREEVMKDIANVVNKDVESLKLNQIVLMLEPRPQEQKRLAKARDALHTSVHNLAKVNEMNSALIKQSLELVEFDMNLIKSMNSSPETAEYNRAATVNGGYSANVRGSFDAKQ